MIHFLPIEDNVIPFPASATDAEPRNIFEHTTEDGEVYELYRYCGDQYLRYSTDGNDAVPAQVIPLPPDVLAALAKIGVVDLPHGGHVS